MKYTAPFVAVFVTMSTVASAAPVPLERQGTVTSFETRSPQGDDAGSSLVQRSDEEVIRHAGEELPDLLNKRALPSAGVTRVLDDAFDVGRSFQRASSFRVAGTEANLESLAKPASELKYNPSLGEHAKETSFESKLKEKVAADVVHKEPKPQVFDNRPMFTFQPGGKLSQQKPPKSKMKRYLLMAAIAALGGYSLYTAGGNAGLKKGKAIGANEAEAAFEEKAKQEAAAANGGQGDSSTGEGAGGQSTNARRSADADLLSF